jgi:ABC-type Fe3+ transport system permease subunit
MTAQTWDTVVLITSVALGALQLGLLLAVLKAYYRFYSTKAQGNILLGPFLLFLVGYAIYIVRAVYTLALTGGSEDAFLLISFIATTIISGIALRKMYVRRGYITVGPRLEIKDYDNGA